MSKIDFEKDRRRRLKRDTCADAPWRNLYSNVAYSTGALSAHPDPSSHRMRRRTRDDPEKFVPRLDGTLERLESMAADLAAPYVANWPKWLRRRELKDTRAKMRRIVEREGKAIKATGAFRKVEAACKREAEALQRLVKRKVKRV